MKKLILISCMLAIAVSCTRDHLVETTHAISFDTYAVRTKAGDSYISKNIPEGGRFGVFAYFHPAVSDKQAGSWTDKIQGGANANRANLMLNQPVEKICPSANTYSYYYPDNQSRYWPRNPNDRISFFAYYPYAAGGFNSDAGDVTGITLQDPDDDTYGYAHNPVGFPKFRFSVHKDPSEQVDFMISDMCLDQCRTTEKKILTGADGTVMFTFHHMLSQIRIKEVKILSDNDKVTVTIDSVKFTGVPVRGIVTPSIHDISSVGDNGYARMDFTWSGLYTDADGFRAPLHHTGDSEIMLMIPHTFTEKDKIEVYYSITREDSELGEHYTYRDNILSARLDASGITGWERNKIYNYNISFSLKDIRLTAEVEDWPEASTDVNTIRVDLVNT